MLPQHSNLRVWTKLVLAVSCLVVVLCWPEWRAELQTGYYSPIPTFSDPKNLGPSQGSPASPGDTEPPPSCCEGNPINAATGNKFQMETDYVGAPNTRLELRRFYNSQDLAGSAFGAKWHSTYHRGLVLVNSTTVAVTRADGRVETFTRPSGVWTAAPDVISRLTPITNGIGTQTGWNLVTSDDDREAYALDGRLLSMTTRAGLITQLSYDASNRLTQVTGPFGHVLHFTVNGLGQVVQVTLPDGTMHSYGYDSTNNLTRVTYANAVSKTYGYTSVAGLPGKALTSIIDENGILFASFTYDTNGRALSSTHPGGVDRTTLVYNANGTVTATDARGNSHTYNLTTQFGTVKPMATSGTPCFRCGGQAFTYDANGFLASRMNFNGQVTSYVHDARGLTTRRVEAVGTPQERTMTMAWHATFRLMTRMAEPLRLTTRVYDDTGATCGARGALCSTSVQATTDATGAQGFNATVSGAPRIWRYSYNSQGQVLTVDGPRTDVADLTRYTYDTQGNVTAITNALGHVTQITAYNAHGQPLTIVDPNGLTTTLTYDLRQRLTERTVGTETTTYAYDGVGQLTEVTLPDDSFVTYSYDAARRLIGIADAVGNRITYTLDAVGNRTKDEVFDPVHILTQTRTRAYNPLNRLAQDIGAEYQTTHYDYDDQGNRTRMTDPLNHTTASSFDALNRLVQMTDPNNGTTRYAYDGLNQLASVTDPRHLTTHYSYTGLGDLPQMTSPDTGTTHNMFDDAGNIIASTDAKGQTTSYLYDALNRVIQIVYAGGITHSYQYDQGQYGLGRLTTLTDPSSSTSYAYDQQGRMTTETRMIAGKSYTTRYRYNAAGQMVEMIYPSGRVLTYSYDAANRVASLTLDGQPMLSAITYQPFGAVTGWTFGNGAHATRSIDLDGRMDAYSLGTDTRTLVYDPASRIVGFDHSNAQFDQTFDYDALDRLTAFIANSAIQGYDYDAVSNRTSLTHNAQASTYSYASASNRLSQVSGTNPKTYSYDANGSVTGDGTNSFILDARGRLVQATTPAGVTQYSLNALGQRVQKATGGSSTVFHYDTSGHLIAESDTQGVMQKDYIYLGDMPVALLAVSPPTPPPIRLLDLNADGCIDSKDAAVIMSALNKPASGANDPRDLDHDGKITVLDARKLALLCDQAGCKACPAPGTQTSGTTALYYLYPDHLNTTRVITDTSNKVVWRWDSSDPFGAAAPQEDPDGDGKAFTFNPRFPGQYFDQETGLHYNGFRDYNPATGRYVQSDPIGLAGGVNTYGYVGGNPVRWTDSIGTNGTILSPGAADYLLDLVSDPIGVHQAEADYRDVVNNRGLVYKCGENPECVAANLPQFNKATDNLIPSALRLTGRYLVQTCIRAATAVNNVNSILSDAVKPIDEKILRALY